MSSDVARPSAAGVRASSAGEGALNLHLLALRLQWHLVLLVVGRHRLGSSPFCCLLLLDFHLTESCFIFLYLLLEIRLASLNALQFDFHVAHVFFLVLVPAQLVVRWRRST